MKKVLLGLLLCVLACSCKTVQYKETSILLDLREYSGDKDFIINPSSIANGEFTPIGKLSIDFKNGNKVNKKMKEHTVKKIVENSYGVKYYVPSFKRIVSKSVEEAKSLGANGIIAFNIEHINDGEYGTYRVTGIPVVYKK